MDITTNLILTHSIVFLLTLLLTTIASWLIARRSTAATKNVHASESKQLQGEVVIARELLGNSEAENTRLQSEMIALKERLQAEMRHGEERLQNLKEARDQMTLQFKSLANEILETKSKKFTEQNSINLETLLSPLKTQINDFRSQITSTHTKQTKQRESLRTEIKLIRSLNAQITEEARNLTGALKNETKTQGIWREMILERILESSGLRQSIEYNRELSHTDEDSRRKHPNVIINLPDSKHIVVNSKVSLKAYKQYCSADCDASRKTTLNKHMQSLKRHVKLLSEKNYETLPKLNTIDFILIFVPLNPAYIAAAQTSADLMLEAFDKKIIIVGPSTLLATLRTIQNIWRYEHQSRNAVQIAEEANKLYDKFVVFSDSLEKVNSHLGKAQDTLGTTRGHLIDGRKNLVKQVEALKEMGAKAKKQIKAELLVEAGSENLNTATLLADTGK